MPLIDLDEAKRMLSSMADSMEHELGPESRYLAGYRRAIGSLDLVRPVARNATATPTEE